MHAMNIKKYIGIYNAWVVSEVTTWTQVGRLVHAQSSTSLVMP